MTKSELVQEYEKRRVALESLRSESVFALERALSATTIKLHSVTSRVKTLDSFVRKVERKNAASPFDEIRDLVGVRVVCLFLSDLPSIGAVIRSTFDVSNEENKIEVAAASSFGYMSVHFDVAMKATYAGPRYDMIAGLPLEIQVRTIAMDAWANVSHHLSYRSDVDVPDDLRKDFYALSGLFYVADKHFEVFYRASIESKREAAATVKMTGIEMLLPERLNADTLAAYLTSTFPERRSGGPEGVSELLADLLRWGARTVGDVDSVIQATERAFAAYEAENPPSEGTEFLDIGVVRISFHLFDSDNYRISYEKTFGNTSSSDFEAADEQYQHFRHLVRRAAG